MSGKDSKPEIILYDVLQITDFSRPQLEAMGNGTLYNIFKEVDQVFKEYDYPVTVAMYGQGVFEEKEWVDYLNSFKSRYKLELQGLAPKRHKVHDLEQLKYDLLEAIDVLEGAFAVKLTTWYPPWDRENVFMEVSELCNLLKLDVCSDNQIISPYQYFKKPKDYNHIDFNFWDKEQLDYIKKILKELHK